ncbi:MAG: PEP-CTERM sorting domain-containing protein [Verrucomicrobiota bacterium]
MTNKTILTAACLSLLASGSSFGFVTSMGQSWDYEPDSWSRGSGADTAFFGWDVLDASGVFISAGQVLDDSTPDLGVGTTGARFYQGTDGTANPAPTFYGHRSGSGNYYSGFLPAAGVDNTITGTAPASGSGGHTTIVLQAIGQPENSVSGISWTASAGWTKVKDLYGTEGDGTGVYWQEWTATGDNLSFSIDLNGPPGSSSYGLDAFTVDTYWTDGGSAAANSITIVPEPSSALLIGLAASVFGFRRRRS